MADHTIHIQFQSWLLRYKSSLVWGVQNVFFYTKLWQWVAGCPRMTFKPVEVPLIHLILVSLEVSPPAQQKITVHPRCHKVHHTVPHSPKSPSAFHIISATVNSFSHKALWWGSLLVSQFQSHVFVKGASDSQQEETNCSFSICAFKVSMSRWRPWCLWKQFNSYTFAEPQSQFRCSVPTWLSAIKLCGGWCTARS